MSNLDSESRSDKLTPGTDVELVSSSTNAEKPSTAFDSNITIAFKNVTNTVQVPTQEGGYDTFISPFVNAVKLITSCGKSSQMQDFHRIENASGIIKPGTMTLVIAPPGHGKSTYLKSLAQRIELKSGQISYNGRTFKESEAEGCDMRKMNQYVDQVDCHLPLLTVAETLDFAHKMSSHTYNPQRVEDTITLLGLQECRDTILGNAFIRGVSGGQKRRVTVGEMLVSDACNLFLDEYTNGLDTATSEDITRGLRQWVQKNNSTIVATLQQPTPGLYNAYDNIVILRDANVIYHGPREDVLPFFEGMGFTCPDDVDVCDFLIDCLSQPMLAINRQQDEFRAATKSAIKHGRPAPQLGSVETSFGTALTRSPSPCVTTQQMVAYYKSTPMWQEIETDLFKFFPADNSIPDPSTFDALLPTEHSKDIYCLGYRMPVMEIFKLVIIRQFIITFRNKSLIMPRIFQVILMGLVYGSLYYQIAQDQHFLRVLILLISIVQIAFGNMVELPIAVTYTRVVKKQMGANFYPAWSYVFGSAITSFPLSVVETVLFGTLVYWMADNYPGGPEFMTFLSICIVQSFNMSVWFRFLSAVGKDEASAQAMAGPSTGVMMVFGGFFVSENNLKDFMVWIFWLSPFSWSVRALANNEFLAPGYDRIMDDGVRLGDAYLASLDVRIGYEWIGYAVLYLFGLSAIILFGHIMKMTDPYFEMAIGTRRSTEDELVESDLDKEGNANVAPQIVGLTSQVIEDPDEEEPEGQDDGGMVRTESTASLVRDASSFNPNTLKTLREALPFTPTWLSFSDVKYTVEVKKDGKTVDRVLLDGVSGYAEPGKLTALMGASGAGKTTLLDVLAGRKNMGVIEGTIMLNGNAPTPKDFASITGYVEQFDSLLAFDTVRETLFFAARLRLPADVSDEIKNTIVDEILEILDLSSIQDFIIGNETLPGLSPSQLKRVNIGVELVANPSVLFLDEPTTGLDSKAAQTVMRVVRRIARSGRSVVCTIHQPSAELFYLFDRLVLLASGGHQIYFGDLGRRSAKFIKYLQSVPGVKPIPARSNPASWMLEELGVGVAAFKETSANDGPQESQEETVQRFKAFYFKSRTYRRVDARLHALETLSGVEEEIEYSVSRNEGDLQRQASYSVNHSTIALPTQGASIEQKLKPGLWTQYILLQKRSFISYWRNPPFIFSRLTVVTLLSVIFGLIYLDLTVDTPSAVISSLGSMVIAAMFGSLIHGATSLPNFMNNRAVFYRERASDMYAPGLWAIIGFFTEMIWCAIGAFLIQISVYWMVGMRAEVNAYFKFYFVIYLLCLCFVSMSMLIAAIAPTTPIAGVIQGMYFAFFNTFSGISITQPNIPAGWMWVFRMLPMSHATEALVMPQFDICSPLPQCGPMIPVITEGETTMVYLTQYVSDYLGFGFTGYWSNIGWIILFLGVVLILAYTATSKLVYAQR